MACVRCAKVSPLSYKSSAPSARTAHVSRKIGRYNHECWCWLVEYLLMAVISLTDICCLFSSSSSQRTGTTCSNMRSKAVPRKRLRRRRLWRLFWRGSLCLFVRQLERRVPSVRSGMMAQTLAAMTVVLTDAVS